MKKLKNILGSKAKTPNEPSIQIPEVMIKEEAECPDGGYGWVICLAAAVIQFVIFGIHNNFGVLYTHLMRDLKVDPTEGGAYDVDKHFFII